VNTRYKHLRTDYRQNQPHQAHQSFTRYEEHKSNDTQHCKYTT
jgi:hypothetical protein